MDDLSDATDCVARAAYAGYAMRVVSYNILEGGEGRADPLAEIILARRPDVVCLVEADNDAVLERIAGRLKMDYIVARGGRDGVALLSRWPIVETVDHAALHAAFTGSLLEAVVLHPTGREWPIGVVHLSARATEERERQREEELKTVLEVFAEYRANKRPHILAGDFNASAPSQEIDPSQCKPATRAAWESNGGQIPRRVVQRLLDAGYLDSLQTVIGSAANVATSFTTNHPGQRLDYIFTFGVDREQLGDAWIEQDRLAKYASDHYPVGVELR